MEQIIEINGLNKTFGDVRAVKDLSFKVKKGELFAFLGVNGAGNGGFVLLAPLAELGCRQALG